MNRQTKLGLLVILVFVIAIGVVLSGQVRDVSRDEERKVDGVKQIAERSIPRREPAPSGVGVRTPTGETRVADSASRPAAPVEQRAGETRLRDRAQLTVPHQFAAADAPAPVGRTEHRAPVAQPSGQSPAAPSGWMQGLADGRWRPADEAGQAYLPQPRLVDARLGQVPSAGQAVTYVVQSGDTLGDISQKFYNTTRNYPLIYEANRTQMSSPDVVREGMTLVIPPLPGLRAAATPAAPVGDTVASVPVPPTPVAPQPSVREVTPSRAAPSAETRVPASEQRLLDASPLLRQVDDMWPGASASARELGPRPLQYREYQVKDGDTLYSIAAEFMGNGRKWPELYQLNKQCIPNPDVLPAGLKIRVPNSPYAARTN